DTSPSTTPEQKEKPVDWQAALQPRGTETRLGQALADELRLYHDSPLAGIVLMSDGAQNAGIEPSAAVEAARQAGVPIYAIGFGSAPAQPHIPLPHLVLPPRPP